MRILVVGGGHATLPLLTSPIVGNEVNVTLLSPDKFLYYSGMMPQFLGGYYSLDQVRIDLKRICDKNGISFIEEPAIKIDAENKFVLTGNHTQLSYDILIINAGVKTRHTDISVNEKPLFNVKPLSELVAFKAWLDNNNGAKVAIAGGGAAGTEIAMSLASTNKFEISLFECQSNILPNFDEPVRDSAASYLNSKGVNVITDITGEIPDHFDCYLNASGNIATTEVISHNLTVDANQRLLTNDFLQVEGHPEIFAAGDIANIGNQNYSQIGVHAVKQGETLKQNIFRFIQKKSLSVYKPYFVNPLIISMGNDSAIFTLPGFSYTGKLALRLKRYLDESWVTKYR